MYRIYIGCFVVFAALFICSKCININNDFYLVKQAYNHTKQIFDKCKINYGNLKKKSLETINTYLNLVQIMNEAMADQLRNAIINYYQIKRFANYTNRVISMNEIVNISSHCLADPIEKIRDIREQFSRVIQNFQDMRNFNVVDKCLDELPDEVSTAYCIMHQAVLINETSHDNLVTIVEVKTRQYAQEMNDSIFGVQECFKVFVPNMFEQLLVDAYTDKSEYMKIAKAALRDIMLDDWKRQKSFFLDKWSAVLNFIEDILNSEQYTPESVYLTLLSANFSSQDVVNIVNHKK